jgi:hypothetical protein
MGVDSFMNLFWGFEKCLVLNLKVNFIKSKMELRMIKISIIMNY